MKELYKKLYESGEYTKSYEEFVSQYGTPDKAQKLYKGLNEAGDYTKSFDEFLNKYKFESSEVKKKVTSEPISTDQELDSRSILGGRFTPVVTGEVEELDVITPAVEVKSSNSYMSDLLVKAQNPERADKYKEKLNYKSDNPVYVDGKVDLIEDPVLKQKLSEDYNIQGALKIGVINQEDVDLALKGDIDSIKKIQEISTLSNKEINDKIKTKRLDVPYAYETFSDLQANIGFEGSVIDSMYDGNELSKIDGFNIIDFDGRLKERGYQEKYQQLLAGEVVSEEGVDVSFAGTQNPNLAAERLKLQYLNEYLGHQLQRDYDFQVLDYKSKNNGHHPALDGVEINPTSGIDKNALTKYIEKSFPIVTAKLKNQDIKNQEIYQQHKNGDIRFFEDLMKQGWRSLEDRINDFSASTYDMIGMDNVAEGIRMGKAETAMGRTGLLRYTFASGKQADVGGTQYLVDENNQIYDVDRKIAVSEVLNPFEAKKIIETVNDIGEKNWSISPTGGAVATAGIVTDMALQIALTRGVGILGQSAKAAILSKAGSKLPFLGGGVKFLDKIPIKATTASAMIAQGTLFSSNLYEQARVQSIDAGLTVQQADEMAAMAGRQGFVLGFFTAPLSTQTLAMNKIFGSGSSEKLIKNATDAYLKGGSKAALGVWQKAKLYLNEGRKEAIQENVQQVGQMYGIGSNVNEAAGVDVMKQNITMDEVINTTILSFIAGMIMPMGGDIFSSGRKRFSSGRKRSGMDAIEKIKSLDILSKDPEKTRELLNSQVNKGVYTEDQVENILADIEMYRTSINSIPTNLSEEISLSVMPDISEINKLKNLKESQEPAFHPAIDKKIAELRNSIVKKSNFDQLSNKAKEDLKNKAMNELLNESEERGETDIELNDNVIIERAIENFSTQEVVEVEDTAEVKDESVIEETVEDQGTEERYKDSQIPVSKQTFTVENDGDETITVEVTTQLDGSRKVVQKLDDGSVAGSEKISKDNTLTNEDYVSKAYGDVKKTEDVDIKTVINPKLESKMSDRQRDAAGFPTLKPEKGGKEPKIIPVKGSKKFAIQVDPDGKVVTINKKTGKPLEKAPPAKVQKIILRDIIDVNEGTRLKISEDTNLTPEQYNSEVVENSNNIKEISETIEAERIRLKEKTKSEKEVEADPLGILDLVSNITEQQFIDASDIANVTNNMKRYWFKKPETNVLGDLIPDTKAFGLDTLVKDLDGYTQENESEYIQKVVDFIIKNDTANLKIKTGKSPGLIDLEIKFEALTGLKPTPTNIKTISDINPNADPISLLSEKEQEQEDFIDSKSFKKSITKKESSGFNIRKLFSGMPVLSYLDDVFYRNISSKLDTVVSKMVTQSIDSKYKYKRIIGQTATNWFNGLPRTVKELARSRRLKGEQDVATVEGARLTRQLQDIIRSNPESASRVHAALDPEMYDDISITYEDLTENEQFLYDELIDLNAQTHELNYKEGFIDKKTYDKFKGKYIARLYEEFEDPDIIKEKGWIKRALKNQITPDIYKERKAIDQWKIDNKVQDPIYLTVNRMIKTARNVAVKSYAESIANSKKASKTKKEGYVLMEGKNYGALSGMYVPHYISEDFQGYSFTNEITDQLYNALKSYDRLQARQVLKKSHTVWNPVVQLGNLLSNFAFAFVTGANAVQVSMNFSKARKSIKTQNKVYQVLVKYGIIGSDVLTNDLRTSKGDIAGSLDKNTTEKAKTIWQKLTAPFIKADKYATNAYGASDDVMKIATYMSLRDAGYSETEAVEKVFDGMQNYATVGKVWDAAAKTPVFGNAYIKFQADLMRITKNAVVKRPLTTASFLGALKALSLVASALSGEDDEKKEVREERGYIPKIRLSYLGLSDIPLVFKVGNKEINLARFISPYYTYHIPNEGLVSEITGFMPYSFESIEGKEMGADHISPEAPDVLLGGLIQAFFQNRDFRNKAISDPYATRYKESGLTEFQKLMNKVIYIGRSTIPAASSIQDMYLSATTGEDYYGRTKSIGDVIMSQVIKIQTFENPEYEKAINSTYKNLQYEGKKIESKKKSVWSKYKSEAERYGKKVSSGKMSAVQANKNMIKAYNTAIKNSNDYLTDLVKVQDKINAFSIKVSKINFKNK
tara:strand:- start:5427 stop:11744 length:6318 start_codon:yes stop_codon:yes gene_type:complete